MVFDNALPVVLALVGAGGIFGGVAAFRKVQPEKESIIVTAAQGALVIQSGVLEELRSELLRAHEQIAELQMQVGAINDEHHAETERLREERDRERAQNSLLRQRVRVLEARVDELEGQLPPKP